MHSFLQNNLSTLTGLRKRKVFCIGHNKTGTTSIGFALKELGYKVGDQATAERLLDDWAVRDFRHILQYCKTAEVFQDIPFSLDFTYQAVDQAFPGSKFVLSVRNSADDWYRSLVQFHAKLLGTSGKPTAELVKQFSYNHLQGWFWRAQQYVFGIDEATIYDENIYKAQYINYNNQVRKYFQFRPNDLLVLNLTDPDTMQTLCRFLGVTYTGQKMPHLNKSSA